jgi:hypothetical protein
MPRRTPQVLGLLCAIFAAGVLVGCGGSGNTGATRSGDTASVSAVMTDSEAVEQSVLNEGDDEPTTAVSGCTGSADGHRYVEAKIPAKSRGMVLALDPATGRRHELWIRRRLPKAITVKMTEKSGSVPGVEIDAPGAPSGQKRWAILILDISGCPKNDDYVVAHQVDMMSRTGALDTTGNRVSGWIKGASGYILAQGIVKGSSSDTTSSDSTAPRSR